MKKILHYTFLLFSLLAVGFIAGCNKDDDANPDKSDDPMEFLNSVNIKKITAGSEVATFTYDNDGRLSSISWTDSYQSSSFNWESEATYTFVYENSKLTKVSRKVDVKEEWEGEEYSESWEDEFIYSYNNNNQLTEIKIVEEGYDDIILKRAYNNEGLISKLVSITDEGVYTENFEWDGKNVSKVKMYGNRESHARKSLVNRNSRKNSSILNLTGARINNDGVFEAETVYTGYDNKKNPFHVLTLIQEDPNFFFYSANNPGKSLYQSYDEAGEDVLYEWTENFSYQYNEEGYPTQITVNGTEDGFPTNYSIQVEYK